MQIFPGFFEGLSTSRNLNPSWVVLPFSNTEWNEYKTAAVESTKGFGPIHLPSESNERRTTSGREQHGCHISSAKSLH